MSAVELEDDPTIPDEAVLLRRISKDWVVPGDSQGPDRVSSQAFQNLTDKNAFSVFIQSECPDVEAILEGYDGLGIASLSAGHVRACGQGVVRSDEGSIPGHAHVVGDKRNRKVRKRLSKGAVILVAPAA